MLRAMLGLNVPFKRGEKIGPLSIWEVVPLFIQQTEWVIHPYQDRGRWQHSCLERDRQCWDGEHTQHTQHQGGGGALAQGRAQGLTTSVADCCSAPTEQCFPLTPSVLPRWSRHCGDLHLGSPFQKSRPSTPNDCRLISLTSLVSKLRFKWESITTPRKLISFFFSISF